MADSANPVSPKLFGAGIGAVAGAVATPILIAIFEAVSELYASGAVVVPDPWDGIIQAVLMVAGTLIGAYLKKDGLRLPTLEPAAVNNLPNAELKLQDAALKLGDPLP